jgi:hypothetical protein
MAFRRTRSQVLQQASIRISGMESIEAALDLGNGLSVETFRTAITEVESLLNSYNTHMALADELRNIIDAKELVLRDFSERMLTGVATKYGKNSNQYQMAGGTRKMDRKKFVRNKTSV